MKICRKCKLEKELTEFYKSNANRGGYSTVCKLCKKELSKIYGENNKEKIKEHNKKYKELNKEKIREYDRKYNINNKDKIKEYNSLNREKINDRRRKYIKRRKNNDPLFRLTHSIRNLIYKSIVECGYKKNSKTENILGISFNDFKLHLESKFETWMNWDNYGLYNGELNYGWDIDHIIPLISCKTEEEIKELNNYTNLQPLCSYTNRVIKRDFNKTILSIEGT